MSRERSRRADYRHFHRLSVRWSDMDALGHVNNAKFFTYSESARIKFFSELLPEDPALGAGAGAILADASCSYHAQLRYPADIEVGLGIERIGSSSLIMRCPIFVAGAALAVADIRTVLVWFDYVNQCSVPVPDQLRAVVREFRIGE